jgi:glycosyltransferase involved in cell wall biosynthesis
MNSEQQDIVAYVGTFPPTECGLATFLLDVVNATDLGGSRSILLPVADEPTDYNDQKVVYTIAKECREDYAAAARIIDQQATLLCLQHEYGIFGGNDGEYVLSLVNEITVPLVVTFHTILPDPSASQRQILREIADKAAAVIVMAQKGVDLLLDYGIDREKIHMIHHGAPNVIPGTEAQVKEELGLTGRRVISTFGLISPSKGIEDAIAAMPAVVEQEPTAVYYILGQTHPQIKKRAGEDYRNGLQAQVRDLGLENHVRFVDKYLSTQELVNWLMATDIYITPYYSNPHQITSGTLAYAMAAAKVIVSTPYTYAQELLADGRGFLYPFRRSDLLAETVVRLCEDPELYDETKAKAFAYGRGMTWPRIGLQYLELFARVRQQRWSVPQSIADSLALLDDPFENRAAPVKK